MQLQAPTLVVSQIQPQPDVSKSQLGYAKSVVKNNLQFEERSISNESEMGSFCG